MIGRVSRMNNKTFTAIAVVIGLGLVVWAFSSRAPAEQQKPMTNSINGQGDMEVEGEQGGGLVIEVLQEGEGEKEAAAGDTVSVHYTGTLEDGTKFDSSLDRGQPITFELGKGRVIKGWDQGIEGMKIGEKRKLTIPPDLAYGAGGSPPAIPPNATLIFETELVSIE